jgi:sugar lactone lactonase YvrE
MTYQPGDTVRFDNATLPANRTRDYTVTATEPDGLRVEAKGHGYFLTHRQAEQLGITTVTAQQ